MRGCGNVALADKRAGVLRSSRRSRKTAPATFRRIYPQGESYLRQEERAYLSSAKSTSSTRSKETTCMRASNALILEYCRLETP